MDRQTPFDVFVSHASEDKDDVRWLVDHLRSVGLRVWLDEEQLMPGVSPREAIHRALGESRHILVWVTDAWLGKDWTTWELETFAHVRSEERRVIPLLRTAWDDAKLGPWLTRQVAVPETVDGHDLLWLTLCGLRGTAPGPRARWGEAWQEAVRGGETGTLPPMQRPSAGRSGRARLVGVGAVVAALLLGGVGAAVWASLPDRPAPLPVEETDRPREPADTDAPRSPESKGAALRVTLLDITCTKADDEGLIDEIELVGVKVTVNGETLWTSPEAEHRMNTGDSWPLTGTLHRDLSFAGGVESLVTVRAEATERDSTSDNEYGTEQIELSGPTLFARPHELIVRSADFELRFTVRVERL